MSFEMTSVGLHWDSVGHGPRKSVFVLTDKIAASSFLGAPGCLVGSPGSSPVLHCGWRRSVYGPPKTAQLIP